MGGVGRFNHRLHHFTFQLATRTRRLRCGLDQLVVARVLVQAALSLIDDHRRGLVLVDRPPATRSGHLWLVACRRIVIGVIGAWDGCDMALVTSAVSSVLTASQHTTTASPSHHLAAAS